MAVRGRDNLDRFKPLREGFGAVSSAPVERGRSPARQVGFRREPDFAGNDASGGRHATELD
jgi:hypothetical protein